MMIPMLIISITKLIVSVYVWMYVCDLTKPACSKVCEDILNKTVKSTTCLCPFIQQNHVHPTGTDNEHKPQSPYWRWIILLI